MAAGYLDGTLQALKYRLVSEVGLVAACGERLEEILPFTAAYFGCPARHRPCYDLLWKSAQPTSLVSAARRSKESSIIGAGQLRRRLGPPEASDKFRQRPDVLGVVLTLVGWPTFSRHEQNQTKEEGRRQSKYIRATSRAGDSKLSLRLAV